MDITLDQSLASAVRYILDNDVEGAKAYFDEIPDSFYVPSVYFPIPHTEAQKVTLRTYRNTINFEIWVMDRTDYDAEARAEALRIAVMLDGLAIPVIADDGTATGKALNVQEPTQRKIDEGIVSVTIPIREYFMKAETHVKADYFIYAWKKARLVFAG